MASFTEVPGGILARIRRTGFPEQSMVWPTMKEAKAWAKPIEDQMVASRRGMTVGNKPVLLKSLVDRHLREEAERQAVGRNKLDVLTRMKELMGDEDARRLTVARIIRYVREQRRVTGVTANIDLSYLKKVLTVARLLWQEPVDARVVDEARDALRASGLASRSNERDRRPTVAELEAIKGWAAAHSKSLTPDIIDFIVDSGFRPPSEIVRLRWADLNEADRTILIRDRKDPRKKYGNHQTVPLLGRTFEIIGRQPRTHEFIFPVNGHSWSTIFPRACKELGIDGLQLYDLRHEAISRLVESGKYSIPEIMLVSGHKDPKQMMRYTQLRAKDLHR